MTLAASGALLGMSGVALAQPHCKVLDIANRLGTTYTKGGGPDGVVNEYDFLAYFDAHRAGSKVADIADFIGLTFVDGSGPDGVVDDSDINAYLIFMITTPSCDTPGPVPCSVVDVADFLGLTIVDGGGPDGGIDDNDFAALFNAFTLGSPVADIADSFGLTLPEEGGPNGVVDDSDLGAIVAAYGGGNSCSGGNRQVSPADIANFLRLTALEGGGPDGVIDENDWIRFNSAFLSGSPDADIADVLGSTVFEGGGPDKVVDQADFDAFLHHWNRGALPVNPRPLPVLAWRGTALDLGDVPFNELGTRAKVNMESLGSYINNRGPLEYARYKDLAFQHYGDLLHAAMLGLPAHFDYAFFDVEVWLPDWDMTDDQQDANKEIYTMVYDNNDETSAQVADSYYTGRQVNSSGQVIVTIPGISAAWDRFDTRQNFTQGKFAKTLWRRYVQREKPEWLAGATDDAAREDVYRQRYNEEAQRIINHAFASAREGIQRRVDAGGNPVKLGMYGYPVRRYPFGIDAGEDAPQTMRTAIRYAASGTTVAQSLQSDIERYVDPLMWMWDLQDVFMPTLYSPYQTIAGYVYTNGDRLSHSQESLRIDARINIAMAHNARIKQGDNKPIIPFVADFIPTRIDSNGNNTYVPSLAASQIFTSGSTGSPIVHQDYPIAIRTLVPALWNSGVDGIIYWNWLERFPSAGSVRSGASSWWNNHFIPALAPYPLP